MKQQPLVSIIIPTFNRAHLIGDTLDSVLAQTYTNWECIIVDDGSCDNTDDVVGAYIAKDPRFKYYHRPHEHLPGGNGARNYGLKQMKGEAFILFDSDDIMLKHHIQFKLTNLIEGNYHFIVTRTKNLNSDKSCNSNYLFFDKHEITPENYIIQRINWLTLDVIIKSEIIVDIKFNEFLDSGQEFNFFSKLVIKTVNARYFNEILSLRRVHNNSIRANLDNQSKINLSAFHAKWYTYLDIKNCKLVDANKDLIRKCIMRIYLEKKVLTEDKFIFAKSVYKQLGIVNFIWYLCMITSLSILGRGFYFVKKIN